METNGIAEALETLRYANAVEVIDEVLAFNLTATLADARQYAYRKKKLTELKLMASEPRAERGACRYCQAEITRGNDGTWYHGRVPAMWGSRGCRSFSFHRLGTWDDNLDRQWKAAPA